ncbi:FkbM family methyltransferase [Clostridium botulinum]
MSSRENNLLSRLGRRLNKNIYHLFWEDIDIPHKVAIIGEDDLINKITKICNQTKVIVEYEHKYNPDDDLQDLFLKMDKDTIIVILGSFYSHIYIELKDKGFKNIYCFSREEVEYANNYFDLLEYGGKISEVYNFLEDDISKKVLENILMARIYDDLSFIDEIQDKKLENEYFDKSIIKLSSNESFVDAGAYDGDTLYKFIQNTNMNFDRVFLFEPDKNNFKLLDNQISNKLLVSKIDDSVETVELGNIVDQINLYNLGVYDKSSVLSFNGNLLKASHVTGNLDMNLKDHNYYKDIIEVVKLDDFLENKNITYIKMDIEGSEYEAVKGAANIISKYKPKLAICIYHTENHLWDIPILIKKLNPNYKIYMRHYNSNLWDTICYAVM